MTAARSAWAGAVLALALLAPSPGAAQPKEKDPAKEMAAKVAADAKVQFDAGQNEAEKGHLRRARALFLASKEILPTSATLLSLADCEVKLGLLAGAVRHYQDAVGLMNRLDRNLAPTKEKVVALEPRVPRLRIDLAAGAPEGSRVLIDGRAVEPSLLGTEMPIDPGNYTVAVSLSRHEERVYPVRLGEKDHKSLTVEPGELKAIYVPPPRKTATASASAAPAVAPESGSSGTAAKVVGFLMTGIGLAGVGVGLGVGFTPDNNTFLFDSREFGKWERNRATPFVAAFSLGGGLVLAQIGAAIAISGFKTAPATVQATAGPGGAALKVVMSF